MPILGRELDAPHQLGSVRAWSPTARSRPARLSWVSDSRARAIAFVLVPAADGQSQRGSFLDVHLQQHRVHLAPGCSLPAAVAPHPAPYPTVADAYAAKDAQAVQAMLDAQQPGS